MYVCFNRVHGRRAVGCRAISSSSVLLTIEILQFILFLYNQGDTPLNLACNEGNMCIVTWLIREAGANPRLPTKVPPFESAFAGKLMPKPLIELGFDIYQRGHDGEYIAHSSMRLKSDDPDFRLRFIDELFDHDREQVRLRDLNDSTPLHLAAGVNTDIVKLLVEKYGADPTCRNRYGRIPLIWSVVDGKSDVAEYLCNYMKGKNMDIDMPDIYGWTALHWSVRFLY